MMNEILRDLINKGKVATFVDDVLVGTEIEEGHDKIVEEILKRLEENVRGTLGEAPSHTAVK